MMDTAGGMTLHVESYSGYKADERPLRFKVGNRHGQPREVLEVVDRWYGSGYQCYRVLADDGNLYILRHTFDFDTWSLDAYRARAGR